MHLWRKNVTAERAGFWAARLEAAGIGPERLVTAETVRAPDRVRLEVYCEHAAEADGLRRGFGGTVRELRPGEWQTWLRSASDDPLIFGRRLLVTPRLDELASLRAAHPGRHVLCIPAAMAFGTGEHATTAMCARLLEAVSRPRAPGAWDVLDLGAGSGILALAGRRLGARTALGLDHDPHAVRTARENAVLNGVRGAVFQRADLLRWTPPPGRTWPVVVANLFSELLIRALPTAIRPALAAGVDSRLIASGVLGAQAPEVEAAFQRAGLAVLETRRRGRWRAFLCAPAGDGHRPLPPPVGGPPTHL